MCGSSEVSPQSSSLETMCAGSGSGSAWVSHARLGLHVTSTATARIILH